MSEKGHYRSSEYPLIGSGSWSLAQAADGLRRRPGMLLGAPLAAPARRRGVPPEIIGGGVSAPVQRPLPKFPEIRKNSYTIADRQQELARGIRKTRLETENLPVCAIPARKIALR